MIAGCVHFRYFPEPDGTYTNSTLELADIKNGNLPLDMHSLSRINVFLKLAHFY
jgi:hypothetical protein